MAPELTFEEYSGDLYRGSLEEEAFGAALPRARQLADLHRASR